jgi:hypothetical protein
MYTYVGMILSPEADLEKTLDKAENILAKFDLNTEVAEYKFYLDDEDVALMQKHYGFSNLDELAEKVEDWTGESGGVDEKGIYTNTTRNPDGHIDSWQLYGPGALTSGIFTTSDAYCEAIIMDDGVWQASPDVIGLPPEEQTRVMDEWEANLEQTIKANQDNSAIIARCHS